jgi:serine/threonine protein kinase
METYLLPYNFILKDKYNIKKVLGEGGFGITYLACDNILDIDVCVKELYISGSSSRGENMTVLTQNMKEMSFSDFKERFLQEARQLARFNHINIVRVLDFFEANNTAYVVMEYLKGKTIKELVAEKGPLGFEESKGIINQLLNAVEVVHNAGMLHRDIKPDNLILTEDNRVVLIDFGSARAYSDEKTISQTAMVSPGFAPLEQYNPKARKGTYTDVYSIGATLYYMLTGVKPLNVTERYLEKLPAPHELDVDISLQVSSAVMLAMEMKPEERFKNVTEFRIALNYEHTITQNEEPELKAIIEKESPEKKVVETLELKKEVEQKTEFVINNEEKKESHSEKTIVTTNVIKEEKQVITPLLEDSKSKDGEILTDIKSGNKNKIILLSTIIGVLITIVIIFKMNDNSLTNESETKVETESAIVNTTDTNKTIVSTKTIKYGQQNFSKDTTLVVSNTKYQANDKQTVLQNNQKIVDNILFEGNVYSGEIKNEKPHGKGRLTFNTSQQIHNSDPKKRMAVKGDYFEGNFYNGKPEYGKLYTSTSDKPLYINFGR